MGDEWWVWFWLVFCQGGGAYSQIEANWKHGYIDVTRNSHEGGLQVHWIAQMLQAPQTDIIMAGQPTTPYRTPAQK